MPNHIHHRADTSNLYHRSQDKQNYKRDKKAQRNQDKIGRQKVKVVHAKRQNVNVTSYTQATAIGLSLLVFNASVLSDIVLSNPNTPPRIKNNKQPTRNTQDTTMCEPVAFNNDTYQQPQASKIIPVTVVPEQKTYLASNRDSISKDTSNIKRSLDTTKLDNNATHCKPLTATDIADKPLESDAENAPIGIDNYYKARFYPTLYQPPLENNTVREVALFKELLKPFKHLPPLAKEKATLMTIQHRISSSAEYKSDQETKGVFNYWSTIEEILSRSAKGVDCEEYAILANFYAMHAQELSYLPQDAKFGIFRMPSHALFYYERTLPDMENPEFYIIDTNTVVGILSESLWWESVENNLKTLKEYTCHPLMYPDFFRDSVEEHTDIIASTLVGENSMFKRGSRMHLGEFLVTRNSKIETTDNWNKRINNNRQIDDSISAKEISLIQYNYIKVNGAHSIPEGTEFSKDDIDYIEALEIKNILGYKELSGEKSVAFITANQAKYLIGSYSQNLDKILTIHDLPAMTEDQKEELLKMYSPVLDRKFTHYDVFPYIPCYG